MPDETHTCSACQTEFTIEPSICSVCAAELCHLCGVDAPQGFCCPSCAEGGE